MGLTVSAYGRTCVLRADSWERLARLLFLTCSWWSRAECQGIIERAKWGRATLALDFETLVLPGEFDVDLRNPEMRATWRPDL